MIAEKHKLFFSFSAECCCYCHVDDAAVNK